MTYVVPQVSLLVYCLVAQLLHFLQFGDNMIPCRTESLHFFMLMNAAAKTVEDPTALNP